MMLTRWWRKVTGREELSPDSPLHRSRQLTTEARLRTEVTNRFVRQVENEGRSDLADVLARVADRMADGPNPLLGEQPGAPAGQQR